MKFKSEKFLKIGLWSYIIVLYVVALGCSSYLIVPIAIKADKFLHEFFK